MRVGQQPIQLAGFYLAGLLCLAAAILKLTIEGHWSWWRVLLPLWAVLGHNILYIVVGFAWLFFVPPSTPGEEDIRIREDPPQRYEFRAMLCFLLFAHNLLARIEGEDQRMWVGLSWNGSMAVALTVRHSQPAVPAYVLVGSCPGEQWLHQKNVG
jgi:pimeloyl-ACP methyl ester carboxylesterase